MKLRVMSPEEAKEFERNNAITLIQRNLGPRQRELIWLMRVENRPANWGNTFDRRRRLQSLKKYGIVVELPRKLTGSPSWWALTEFGNIVAEELLNWRAFHGKGVYYG